MLYTFPLAPAVVKDGCRSTLRLIKRKIRSVSMDLSARPRSYRSAPRLVLHVLLAFVLIGASTATAQPGGALVQRLDSIAGGGVRENRAVGIVAAIAKGNDTLLLEAYGKSMLAHDRDPAGAG